MPYNIIAQCTYVSRLTFQYIYDPLIISVSIWLDTHTYIHYDI
jgi:hypothetical protein